MNGLIDSFIMCYGIPSICFYPDNSGESVNEKMDELITRLGMTIISILAYNKFHYDTNTVLLIPGGLNLYVYFYICFKYVAH